MLRDTFALFNVVAAISLGGGQQNVAGERAV
jgi:hypothetical protein